MKVPRHEQDCHCHHLPADPQLLTISDHTLLRCALVYAVLICQLISLQKELHFKKQKKRVILKLLYHPFVNLFMQFYEENMRYNVTKGKSECTIMVDDRGIMAP